MYWEQIWTTKLYHRSEQIRDFAIFILLHNERIKIGIITQLIKY